MGEWVNELIEEKRRKKKKEEKSELVKKKNRIDYNEVAPIPSAASILLATLGVMPLK